MNDEEIARMDERLKSLEREINGKWNLVWIIRVLLALDFLLLALILVFALVFQSQINDIKTKVHELSPRQVRISRP